MTIMHRGEQELLKKLQTSFPLLKAVVLIEDHNDMRLIAEHFTESELLDLMFFFNPRKFCIMRTPSFYSPEESGVLLNLLDYNSEALKMKDLS